MTRLAPATELGDQFIVAHAAADHWGVAAKACLEGLGRGPARDSNVGFLYATEAFAEDFGSIATFLRETTRIESWFGGVAPGICAQSTEYRGGGALAVMVGTMPKGGFVPFTAATILDKGRSVLGGRMHGAIVHGDPRHPSVMPVVDTLSGALAQVAGGLVSSLGSERQLAGTLVDGGVSGLLLGRGTDLVVGLTQGCSPIGPIHVVTGIDRNVIAELDGRPALDVLKSEAGDLIARDLRRAAGYIHVGLPKDGGGGADYTVRSLIGIDPARGLLAVGAELFEGTPMMFVRRDANAAQTDLVRMLTEVRQRLGPRQALGALYFTCIARGSHMFGSDGAESAIVREALGGIPLIGFFANGEIAGDTLYGYTGVLAVLARP